MKRIALLISVLLVVGIASAQRIEKESSSATLHKIDRQAEHMKRKILSSKTEVKPAGTIYYVSAEGNDANDGLSPQTPLRSIARVNELDLKPSDGVMFRRGDLWRGCVMTRKGVTYSAYGKGEKPRIYGSPCDAAVEGEWIATDVPNVYMYSMEVSADVGTLVFNGGEKGCAFKVMKVLRDGMPPLHVDTGEEFGGYRDLKRDLDMYHD